MFIGMVNKLANASHVGNLSLYMFDVICQLGTIIIPIYCVTYRVIVCTVFYRNMIII